MNDLLARRHGAPHAANRAARGARRRAAFGLAAVFAAACVGVYAVRAGPAAAPAGAARACEAQSSWLDVRSGRAIERSELFRDLAAKAPAVLLGESHTDADHHAWQLQTLASINGAGGNLVIGFEAFPRRLQSVLDDWVAGKLSPEAFLKASEWRQVWGYDAALYMPLFQFARINRIPMVGLNVDRSLVARVGQEGWDAVPKGEREGLSDPAPASADYQRELAQVYAIKKLLPPGADPTSARATELPKPDAAALAEAMKEPQFKRFVEAQLTWDRAMAEALAGAKRNFSGATIVGIVGSGHVEDRHGIPHQLDDLRVGSVTTLIPVAAEEACKLVGTSYADAVFTLPKAQESPPPERPRLGVLLAQGDGAPRVKQVVAGSVAEATGLQADDDIVRAAGLDMRKPDDLVEVVGRQAPGTWLPLSIRRDGKESDLLAKFPPRPRQE